MTDDLIGEDETIILDEKSYISDKRKRTTRVRRTTWAVRDKHKPGRALLALKNSLTRNITS
ncbi:MAG: hypothetical protein P8M25_15565 [Paracoccaceae bacterium]|nr:hypothetical protein [Paracoccaceae bacterium]